jgi:hypothetical protein
MSPRSIERDLTRLADGTLHPGRREPLGRLVAGSPELQQQLSDQRRAVAAARYAAQRDRAPLSLRMRRRELKAPARARRFRVTLGLTTTLAALGSVLALLTGSGAPGLTVAQAATLATRPALARVAEPRDGATTLPGLRAQGLPFPYWQDRFGWRATGMRTDHLSGRDLTTVFYRHEDQRIAYTIVSGKPLTPDASAISTTAGWPTFTWTRAGHTCVLSGQNVSADQLIALATWGEA